MTSASPHPRALSEAPELRHGPLNLWVIPNGHGDLWTPHVFDSEEAAYRYQDDFWRGANQTLRHKPRLMTVEVVARPAALSPKPSETEE